MPVTDQPRWVIRNCIGGTEYSFSFRLFTENDLEVIQRDTDGNETKLTLNAGTDGYTVAATNDDFSAGGTVTTTETYSSGTLLIRQKIQIARSTDFEPGGDLSADLLDRDLDKAYLLIAQLQAEVDRCLKFPASDDMASLSAELPASSQRASKYGYFDAEGDASAATEQSAGALTVSAFIENLLDDSNASEARKTLGEWDLIITQNSDWGYLKSDADGGSGTYQKVLVKDGNYSITHAIDLEDRGVEYLTGETPLTQLTFSVDANPLVQLPETICFRNLTIKAAGTPTAQTQIVVQGKVAGRRCYCENIYVENTVFGSNAWVGFENIYGGMRYCRVYRAYYGFKDSRLLTGCEAYDCLYGFNGCTNLASCWGESSVTYDFYGCFELSGCTSYQSGGAGFKFCERLSACHTYDANGIGFEDSHRLSACEAESCGGDGFEGCLGVAGCRADSNGGHGFDNSKMISGAWAFGNTSDGFYDCDYLSGLHSNGNGRYGLNVCTYVSAAYATANTTANWNGGTKIDSDSCNNT